MTDGDRDPDAGDPDAVRAVAGQALQRESRREWQRQRRAVARRHHPDRGGDPERYHRELAEVDARFLARPATVSASRLHGAGRLARRVARQVRQRLPRGWPGARRYLDL